MNYKFLAVVILAAILAVPAVSANEGKIILNPADHTAQVYENYTVNMHFTGSQGSIAVLNAVLKNFSREFNVTRDTTLYSNLSNAIKHNASATIVSHLLFELNGLATLKSNTSFYYNLSLGFAYNVTGTFNSNAWNLSWRSTSFYADTTTYAQGEHFSDYTTSTTYVNMTGMSVPLSKWARTYDASANMTTFSHTVSTSFNLSHHFPLLGLWMNLSYDPTYKIVTPGNAVASADTISYASTGTPPPNYGPFIGIGIIVVIALLVSGIAIRRRGRKK